jgi:hypothetical protein
MKTLGPEDVKFRKLVESLDGHQPSIAEVLGICREAVTHRLMTEKHSAWWIAFKTARSRRRHRAMSQRRYAKQKARQAEVEALLHGGKAADAILLRALMEEL